MLGLQSTTKQRQVRSVATCLPRLLLRVTIYCHVLLYGMGGLSTPVSTSFNLFLFPFALVLWRLHTIQDDKQYQHEPSPAVRKV